MRGPPQSRGESLMPGEKGSLQAYIYISLWTPYIAMDYVTFNSKKL